LPNVAIAERSSGFGEAVYDSRNNGAGASHFAGQQLIQLVHGGKCIIGGLLDVIDPLEQFLAVTAEFERVGAEPNQVQVSPEVMA
jgi:hypothetical protein